MNDSNRLLGGITLGAGIVIFLLCRGIDTLPDTRTLSPDFFPQLLAVALSLLGIGLLIQGKGRPLPPVAAKVFQSRNLAVVGLTLLYTCAFGYGDYRLNTVMYIALVMGVLGCRSRTLFLTVPVLATAVMYGIFRYGFLVLLPTLF